MSNCDVDFADAGDDADPVQFYDWKMVRARKPHICTECGGAISVGEEHKRISYRFDGKFHTDRLCPPCHEAAGEFEHSLVGGMLWESFAEAWDNGAHVQACINRLETARAKEHMRQQWLTWQARRAEERQRWLAFKAAKAAGAVARSDGTSTE